MIHKQKAPQQASPGISPADIYYILFRHKWLIAGIMSVAIIGAIAIRLFLPVPYMSEAKILIKFIKETRPLQPGVSDALITRPDMRNEDIINSEVAILTSFDLAEEVAKAVTPVKILGKKGVSTNSLSDLDAAAMVKKGLVIPMETTRSDIITLTFSHPDQDEVVPVLKEILEVYKTKHSLVHTPEINTIMTEERDRIKANVADLDLRLSELRKDAGIMTIEDSKRSYNEFMTDVQRKITDAQAEEAGYQETIRQMTKILPPLPSATVSTNAASTTNELTTVPSDTLADYQRVLADLANQKEKVTQMLGSFTTNYPPLQIQQGVLVQLQTQKKTMEKNFPGLLGTKSYELQTSTGGRPEVDPRELLNEQKIKADALEKTIEYLTNSLAQIQRQGTNIIANEGPMTELQTEKAVAENQLSYYQQRLDEDRINSSTDNSGYFVVESPTPPVHDMAKLTKMALEILMAGFVFAFGLPFFIELYLDRSLKRPEDVQLRLGLPFFISIPMLGNGNGNGNGNGKLGALPGTKRRKLLLSRNGSRSVPKVSETPAPAEPTAPANGHLAMWDDNHRLQPFYETLRDRLMTYFEMINLTHKPKLVAVTSCRAGAGVTSTAAGLAASLSETGDGNVLLVNMNQRDGETQHFYKGKLTCGLDEVLEKETRENGCVQSRLYVAKEQHEDDRLPRVLPKRFSHLLPKMKASDFDYIIFDMPPVSHISITPRLARFMDMVLMVIESGQTDRDAAKRAADLLSESKTNVGVILNKNRSYLPTRLQHEI